MKPIKLFKRFVVGLLREAPKHFVNEDREIKHENDLGPVDFSKDAQHVIEEKLHYHQNS